MNMVKPLVSDRMFNETATASLSFTGMFYFLDTTIVYRRWRVDHWWPTIYALVVPTLSKSIVD